MFKDQLPRLTLALALANVSPFAAAGPVSQAGTMIDHTAIVGGLLIRFDHNVTALPDNCAGASSTWMFVSEQHKALTLAVLMAVATNNREIVVYTNGVGPSGYCEVGQFNPAN